MTGMECIESGSLKLLVGRDLVIRSLCIPLKHKYPISVPAIFVIRSSISVALYKVNN